jgi:hypothetical protein
MKQLILKLLKRRRQLVKNYNLSVIPIEQQKEIIKELTAKLEGLMRENEMLRSKH